MSIDIGDTWVIWQRRFERIEAQRDSARRLANHAFTRLCAAEDLLRDSERLNRYGYRDRDHGAAIREFLQTSEGTHE